MTFFEEKEQIKANKSAEIGTINTANLTSSQAEYGTHEYWNKLERDGKITREQKFRKQHESLQELGTDKYYNN